MKKDEVITHYEITNRGNLINYQEGDEILLTKYPVIPYPAIVGYRQPEPRPDGYHHIVNMTILRQIDLELKQRPIPPYKEMKLMPIQENGEPLVNLLKLSPKIINLMTEQRLRYEGLSQPRLECRKTVADKLLGILKKLRAEYGLGIVV